MRVTKQNVIDAIKNEPLLIAGPFAEKVDEGCAVCAVGAVIRQSFPDLNPRQIARVGRILTKDVNASVSGDYTEELRQGRPYAALSCFFEQAMAEHGLRLYDVKGEPDRLERVRQDVIEFVEEQCPDDWDMPEGLSPKEF